MYIFVCIYTYVIFNRSGMLTWKHMGNSNSYKLLLHHWHQLV